jgi:Na+(H+)/acetate symporter ActP
MVLIAEPLRRIGRYTFVDVVALHAPPPADQRRLGALTVILFYLTVQMVGAEPDSILVRSSPAAVLVVGLVLRRRPFGA